VSKQLRLIYKNGKFLKPRSKFKVSNLSILNTSPRQIDARLLTCF